MRSLIIAEKASVGRDIAKALNLSDKESGYIAGDRYTVTWARGHLLELESMDQYDARLKKWSLDTLPYCPKVFKYDVIKGASKEYNTIKKLIKSGDYDEIILATDNDREGQLIGDTIFAKIGTGTIPVKRLLQDDWRESTVKNGLSHLIDNSDMSGLSQAGYCRQHMDWIIGINLTRAATVKYGVDHTLNVGRIILPTLKFVYDRDKAIEDFKEEDYFKLIGTFSSENGEYEGTYETKERITDKAVLEQLKNDIAGKDGIVHDKTVKAEKKWPGLLFNQAALQAHMTKKYNGWTAAKVLEVSQKLYEKKVQSYPRTESRYLPTTSEADVKNILNQIGKDVNPRIAYSDRPFNDKKVDSHGAIVPTGETASLSDDEALLYHEVKQRFLEQFMPPAIYEKTRFLTKVGDTDFVTTGSVQKDPGWEELGGSNNKDKTLPDVSEDETVDVKNMDVKAFKTKPPKPMTEAELIKTMENCGRKYKSEDEQTDAIMSGFSIGTGATRDQAIEKIIRVGYVKRQKKQLTTTDLGKKFVEGFPAKKMFNAEFTGKIEYSLKRVEKGEVSPEAFMTSVKRYTKESVDAVKESTNVMPVSESLGKCPVCGKDVVEGNKVYRCIGKDFLIFKDDRFFKYLGKSVSKSAVKEALSSSDHTVTLKGIKGWHGDSITLKLVPVEGKTYYKWEAQTEQSNAKPMGEKCPICGSELKRSERGISCSNKDCHFGFALSIGGHTFTEEEIDALVHGGKTDVIKNLKSKKGKTYDASFYVDKEAGKVSMAFSNKPVEKKATDYKCPVCGEPIVEVSWGYTCCHYKDCKFHVGFKFSNKKIPKKAMDKLLKGEKTDVIKGLKSKSGKSYDAALQYDKDKGFVHPVFDND